VLGSGANLLVADEGVDGVVVHLGQGALRESSTLHRHRPNRAGSEGLAHNGMRLMAGAALEPIVMSTAMAGMSGLEMMAGIPATIGGAIRMNAGGKYGEISEVVSAVGALNIKGEPVVYRRDEIEFGYRRCSISDPVIEWVELALTPDEPKVTHARVKEYFAYKKNSQTMADRSAGCVFQNPMDPECRDRRLSAGMLIDRAGLKGHAIGQAQISDKHANFFTAHRDGKAADVLALIELAQQRVADESGIELHRELVVWKRRVEHE
jgi:UDP-N-acetylmuramate dehydrogenase